MFRTSIAWLAVIALVACQQRTEETGEMTEPAVDVAAESRAIDQLRDHYAEVFNAGDVEGVLATYTSDAVEIAGDGSAQTASSSVRNTMGSAPGARISIDTEKVEVASSGDLAYDRGTYTITSAGPDGQTISQTFRYLVVLKKDGGEWKLAGTMSSAPIGG